MLERDDVRRAYKLIDGNVGVVGKKITLPLYLGAFINAQASPAQAALNPGIGFNMRRDRLATAAPA